ncbi:hypothetical protein B0H14DRAFT_2380929, partial [Mycena olivaceomarginata]
MALLLRSVYTVGSPITTTSAIPIVQKVVDALLEADSNVPSVTLKPFSHSKISTSCYLLPAHDPDEPDEVPRFDILETWRETLRKAKPEWEIVWQLLAEGKDKCMCVRFGDAGFKKERGDKSACSPLQKVKTALAARGILSTDSYSLPTGSYLTLADHRHVDDILSAAAVSVPSVSPNPIPVMRCRQIEIEHCFEIIVSVISEGEGIQSALCSWVKRNVLDTVSKETCFVDARVPESEPDCLVFYMTDWSATSRLLAIGDKMVDAYKSHAPSIHRPQLVLAYNNNGVWRPKMVTQTFRDGADSLNQALLSVRAEVTELRRETHAQHESTQKSISVPATSVTSLGSTVENLHTRLSNHAAAFLVMTGEQSTRAKLAQVQLEMAQHQNTIKFAPPEYHDDAKAEYAKLFKEQVALTKSLSASAGQSIALLGGTLSSSLPPPNSPPGILAPASIARAERSRTPPLDPVSKRRRATNEKDDDSAISKLPSSEYNIFEEEAVPLSHDKGHKWGVAVGIRKDLQISQCVLITKASLKGRLLAIDVVLPTNSGHGFVHRIMGVYTPWDPGINNVDPDAREFWTDVTTFCNETLTSWSMAGDCNATVTSSERATDNGDART